MHTALSCRIVPFVTYWGEEQSKDGLLDKTNCIGYSRDSTCIIIELLLVVVLRNKYPRGKISTAHMRCPSTGQYAALALLLYQLSSYEYRELLRVLSRLNLRFIAWASTKAMSLHPLDSFTRGYKSYPRPPQHSPFTVPIALLESMILSFQKIPSIIVVPTIGFDQRFGFDERVGWPSNYISQRTAQYAPLTCHFAPRAIVQTVPAPTAVIWFRSVRSAHRNPQRTVRTVSYSTYSSRS